MNGSGPGVGYCLTRLNFKRSGKIRGNLCFSVQIRLIPPYQFFIAPGIMVQFTNTPSTGTEAEKVAVNGVSSATASGQDIPNGTTKRKTADSGVNAVKNRKRSRHSKANGRVNGTIYSKETTQCQQQAGQRSAR